MAYFFVRATGFLLAEDHREELTYNSHTTEMAKGVIAGIENASLDRSVVAVVFTGTGPYSFCTGGNTKE